MRAAVLLLLFCGCIGAQPAALEGMVVNSVTGEPLSGVHVRLLVGSPSTSPTVVYGAMTGPAGKFSIDPIAAGTYYAMLERSGFVSPMAIKPVVKLKAGERVSDLKLEMAPRTTISGRVLDEYGDLVQNVSVQATPSAGRPVYQSNSNFASTDDRGEFRVGVGPGKYHIRAMQQSGAFMESGEVRTDGTSEAVYGTTYYPSAATPERAVAIEAVGGREITGIEIRLARRPSLTISGVVTGLPGEPRHAFVNLVFIDAKGRGSSTHSTSLRPDGKFAFAKLVPGLYRIYAQGSSGEEPLYSPLIELTLDFTDVSGLQLPLAPAEDLTGSVQFDGEPADAAQLEALTVRLQAAATGAVAAQGTGPGKANKDGAFRLRAVAPGRYRVRVEPMPENGYIKIVQLDGAMVSDGVLDLTHGGGGSVLSIVLSRNAAQISGTVKDRNDNPASETDGVVYLFQDPENLREENLGRISAEGKYGFKAVRPGSYRLIAVEPLFLAGVSTSDALKELGARAEQIEVKERDRLTKDLKITVREDADAKKR